MRVLLIEAPYSYGTARVIVGRYFPLGVGYLAAYLQRFGHRVRIFQPEGDRDLDASLLKELERFAPNLVGISVMTPSYPEAVRLSDLIKAHHACRTVLGGHHVSAVGESVLLESASTDFAVVGEGEETLRELAEALERGATDLSAVRGLIWREIGSQIRRNPPRDVIQDLDSLPFPARNLVDMNRFRLHSYIDFGKKSATMITSRGCPFKCIFCSSWLTMGTRYRYRSVGNVLEEIREVVECFGVDHLVFEDDTLTLRRDRVLDLCAALEEMPNRPSWYCLSRADAMDYALAKRMKAAGCKMVAFGIESGSPEILERIGKKISLSKAEEAVKACARAGLRSQCTFIVGFPWDTAQTMRMTLEAAKRINPTIAIFFPLVPYPGTRVFQEFLAPELSPRTLAQWRDFIVTGQEGAMSVNPTYGGPETRRLARRWNRRYYLRPAHWVRMLRTVSNSGEFMRLARAGLYLARSFIQ
jgi:radical SAM superfamily enzyme YgiQ (UPF0313 family)